jgi:hypothetical protein
MKRALLILALLLAGLALWRGALEREDPAASLSPGDAGVGDGATPPVMSPRANAPEAAAPAVAAAAAPADGEPRAVDRDLARLHGTLVLHDARTDTRTTPTGRFQFAVYRERREGGERVLRADAPVAVRVVGGAWEVELPRGAWILPFDAALEGGTACFEDREPLRPPAQGTLALEARALHALTLRVVEDETGEDVLSFDLLDYELAQEEASASLWTSDLPGGVRWNRDEAPYGERPDVSLSGELRGTFLRGLRSPFVLEPEPDQCGIQLAVHARGRILGHELVDFGTCESLELRLARAGDLRLLVPDCRQPHRFELTFLPVDEDLGGGWPAWLLEHGQIPLPSGTWSQEWPHVPMGLRWSSRHLSGGTLEIEWEGLAVGRWRAMLRDPGDTDDEHPLAQHEFQLEPDVVTEVELRCPR